MSSNPSERGIRGITRGHLIKTGISAATIGLSPLLSACLVNPEDKARIDARPKDPAAAGAASNKAVIEAAVKATVEAQAGSARKEPTRAPDRLSLKPEDLYRALLTTQFTKDDIPQGFALTKGPYPISSTSNEIAALSATSPLVIEKLAEPFKPTGEVMFNMVDSDKNSYTVAYIIFPDTTRTEDAFRVLSSQPNMNPTGILNLPALEYFSFKPAVTIGDRVVVAMTSVFDIALSKNVLMYAGFSWMLTDNNRDVREKINSHRLNQTSLAQAGVKHLQRVESPR